MKIPRKHLYTILTAIRRDETSTQPNTYVVELTVNGINHTEVFELEDEESVIGSIQVLEPRWWAFDIILGYLRRVVRGESLDFPLDLGDLGDPALVDKSAG